MGKLQVERQDLGPLLVSGDDMLWDSRTKGRLVNSNQKNGVLGSSTRCYLGVSNFMSWGVISTTYIFVSYS